MAALGAVQYVVGTPGRILASGLATVAPKAERRKGEFAVAMVLCNLLSVASLSLWAAGVFNSSFAIWIETTIFVIKWIAEIEYEDFILTSWDLWAHHLIFLLGLYVAKRPGSPSNGEGLMKIILVLSVIHLPLLFRWVRVTMQRDMYNRPDFAKAADTMYLLLWLPVCMIRGWYIAHIYWTDPNPEFLWIKDMLLYRLVWWVIPFLDLLWTPWRRLLELFNVPTVSEGPADSPIAGEIAREIHHL